MGKFGGFGGGFGGFGGGQMSQLVKQAQKMQEDMQKAQEELKNSEVIGQASGGVVTVTMSGDKVLKGIKIDPSVVDSEDVEMLEDLIVVAFNEAYNKAEKLSEEKMGPYTKLGGGF